MIKADLQKALLTLVVMQDSMNSKVNPSWRHANYPFWRAIWTETGEAMDYVSWPWWKSVGPKLIASRANQLHLNLELADILHFGISQNLQDIANSIGEAPDTDHEMVANHLAERYGSGLLVANDGDLVAHLERVAAGALIEESFEATGFFAACINAGLSVAALICYYHGKNALNVFRQEHGYKQGTYRKNWGTVANPQEDNMVLAELIEDYRSTIGEQSLLTHINSGSFLAYLKTNLATTYGALED